MVVFTCNHCGESLRKPAVEKHYNFVCRTTKSLTCVDCFTDFREEEYVVHTKCLTEEERYAARGSMPNGVVKKGELKQESWVDMIKSILEQEQHLKHSHRNLLTTISTYSNIPRKKPKFLNFIKSSSGGRVNMKDVEEVWNIIESYKIKNKAQKEQFHDKIKSENDSSKRKNVVDTSNSNGNTEIEEPKKKKQKKESKSEDEHFNFQTKIINVLEHKGTVSLKKLQKKVVNAYLKHSGETEVTENLVKKFNKKLKKISNVSVTNDNVSLKECD